MERHIEVKVTYDAHETQKREAPCLMPCCTVCRGPRWRRAMGVSSADGGEEERGPVGNCLYWGSGREYSHRGEGIHWCALMSPGQSGDNEGNLWKRPALLCWCAWSLGRGTRDCLWGCRGIRKSWSFKTLERRLLPKCVQFPLVSSELLSFTAIDKIPLVTYLYI